MVKKRGPQRNPILVRVTDQELKRFQKQAGREPLATWARRILLEHCERRERAAKGGK